MIFFPSVSLEASGFEWFALGRVFVCLFVCFCTAPYCILLLFRIFCHVYVFLTINSPLFPKGCSVLVWWWCVLSSVRACARACVRVCVPVNLTRLILVNFDAVRACVSVFQHPHFLEFACECIISCSSPLSAKCTWFWQTNDTELYTSENVRQLTKY